MDDTDKELAYFRDKNREKKKEILRRLKKIKKKIIEMEECGNFEQVEAWVVEYGMGIFMLKEISFLI